MIDLLFYNTLCETVLESIDVTMTVVCILCVYMSTNYWCVSQRNKNKLQRVNSTCRYNQGRAFEFERFFGPTVLFSISSLAALAADFSGD